MLAEVFRFREQPWDGQLVGAVASMASRWPAGRTPMRLGLASSALGTTTCSTLAPGDKQTVSFTLSKSDFGFYDNRGKFVVEPGRTDV